MAAMARPVSQGPAGADGRDGRDGQDVSQVQPVLLDQPELTAKTAHRAC